MEIILEGDDGEISWIIVSVVALDNLDPLGEGRSLLGLILPHLRIPAAGKMVECRFEVGRDEGGFVDELERRVNERSEDRFFRFGRL